MSNTISINLFATLSQYSPENNQVYPIKPGITISYLIQELNLPEKQVKLVFLNGIKSSWDQTLKKGDRLGIFPPIGGG